MNTLIARYASWSAYLAGIAAIVAMVSLSLFFALEMPPATTTAGPMPHIWGPISDISTLFQMLFLLMVVLGLDPLARRGNPLLARAGTAIGVVGALAAAGLQLLLIVGVMPFEQEVGPLVIATGAVGISLLIACDACRRNGSLPLRLAWLGMAVGAAFALEPVLLVALGGPAFWQALMSNYLLMAASAVVFLLAYFGFPVWAFWLGRVLAGANPRSAATVGQPSRAGG
jgi:hypothetical protein